MNPTYNKAKGRDAENAIVEILRSAFPDLEFVERKRQTGAKDQGDITGVPGVTIEVKNVARMDLAGWVAQANEERENARNHVGVVWHKRKGKSSPLEWYVTMNGSNFLVLLNNFIRSKGDAFP